MELGDLDLKEWNIVAKFFVDRLSSRFRKTSSVNVNGENFTIFCTGLHDVIERLETAPALFSLDSITTAELAFSGNSPSILEKSEIYDKWHTAVDQKITETQTTFRSHETKLKTLNKSEDWELWVPVLKEVKAISRP